MINTKWRCWIATLIIAVLVNCGNEVWNNFGATLAWTPGTVKLCESLAEVVAVVDAAKADSLAPSRSFDQQRVKAYGTGWSWSTTLAGDGDTYVRLTGPLADVSTSEWNLSEPSVVVYGGVMAFDLYLALQPTGYNIEAKGACLSAKESQTVGGLLATNVHHSGIQTFYEVVEWVDIVTATQGLVRTYRDETLFRLTVGGGGRTGIIVRAKFKLAQRATYENVMNIAQPKDGSFQTLFQSFVDLTSGYQPNEFIASAVKVPGFWNVLPGVFPTFQAKRRMSEPSENPVVLPSDYGDLSMLSDICFFADRWLDKLLPPILYDPYYQTTLFAFLRGQQPRTDNNQTGEDLDVACSDPMTTHLKHQELEFFVPVDLMGQVGAFLDKRLANGHYPYIKYHGLWSLRSVFGSNSLTAANGVLSEGTSPDRIAVNLDGYQRSKWNTFNREVNEMMADLSAQFPRKIRTHPGKYNPPLSPDPESEAVKDMIEQLDPLGIFARDSYDGTYLTSL